MNQALYAHMNNKRKIKKMHISFISFSVDGPMLISYLGLLTIPAINMNVQISLHHIDVLLFHLLPFPVQDR
jgi:hypothetical protein